MLITDLIIPFTMIGWGLYLSNSSVGIKKLFGYKPTIMMKNIDTEKFAYNFCCKYYFFMGLIMIPISIIAITSVISAPIATVALVGGIIMVLQGSLFVGAYIAVEITLRKKFNKNE